MIKRSISLAGLACLPLLLTLGCGGEIPVPPGDEYYDTGVSPDSYAGWPTADSGVPADTGVQPDSTVVDPPPPGDCPELTGTFEGALTGQLTGFFAMDLEGTVTMTLAPGDAEGNYVITSGKMVAWAKGLEIFPFEYPLTGTVKCGVLVASSTMDITGVQCEGAANCTFGESGCAGTWSGKSVDEQTGGSGTFNVTRK